MTMGATPVVVSERREEILAIAADLFAARGFATTTVRDIADAAGILSGSLYHHFDSKESMVDEILRRFLDEILASYRQAIAETDDPVEALRQLVHIAFDTLVSHRSEVTVMMNEHTMLVQFPRFAFLRDASEETERLWVSVLEHGTRTGVFRADIDPRMMYRFMRDSIWSVRWYRPNEEYRPEDIAPFYLEMLLDGIATDARR
jgi:TetR/AcrR family transcriptional regulator, cholesterol catabolism regulator